MRAVVVRSHGGPEVLEQLELPEPEPGPGEVLVHVGHAALNHLDVWVRRGVPGHRFPLPLVGGSDVVGHRDDTGERVVVAPATSCMACPRCLEGRHDLCRRFEIRGEGCDGGLRERMAVPAWQLLPVPEHLDDAQAAALPLALLTAWHMIVGRARVAPGDRVLVQSGAGGVASMAIQVAELVGARVAATASTEAKRALCLELGAEVAFAHDDALAGVKAWSPGGVDHVVEHVGGETFERSLRMVRWGGTVVTCGATTGHEVPLNLRVLFFKQLSLLGSTMGSFGELQAAWRAVEARRVRAVVDRVVPVRDIADAHRAIEAREVSGKVVVQVAGGW